MELPYKSSRIYVDIDGTLTHKPECCWGEPNMSMINKVRQWILDGHEVIIWSAGGTDYVKDFCRKYNINPSIMIGKPNICIDDCSKIRPNGLNVISPEDAIND